MALQLNLVSWFESLFLTFLKVIPYYIFVVIIEPECDCGVHLISTS